MGSWQQFMGGAFNALMIGRATKPRGGVGRSDSSRSARAPAEAEPTSGETDASPSGASSEDLAASGLDTDASLSSHVAHRLRRRNSYVLATQQDLGTEACVFRDAFFEERGHTQGWLTAFLQGRLGFDNLGGVAAKAALAQTKCAVRTAQAGTEKYQNRRGKVPLAWKGKATVSGRKRRKGGGRGPKCPVIGEELWSWFVDRLNTCPSRIGTQLLIDQADIISTDLYEEWMVRKAHGHADSTCPPDLPAINTCWVHRWRRAYGVTYRTVNLRYKLSHSKRLLRLRVFWSNILRVRLLHEALYGRDGIEFVSMDQQPLYFNSSLAEKTIAPRGAKK